MQRYGGTRNMPFIQFLQNRFRKMKTGGGCCDRTGVFCVYGLIPLGIFIRIAALDIRRQRDMTVGFQPTVINAAVESYIFAIGFRCIGGRGWNQHGTGAVVKDVLLPLPLPFGALDYGFPDKAFIERLNQQKLGFTASGTGIQTGMAYLCIVKHH